ncbi:Uncharacterised protein [Campylobacter jejuni]|nr:Uncharacterised protein [Campylobacter jejuni]
MKKDTHCQTRRDANGGNGRNEMRGKTPRLKSRAAQVLQATGVVIANEFEQLKLTAQTARL